MGDNMDDVAFALDPATDPEHAGGKDDTALPLIDRRPDNEIGDAGFVLDRDEHDALGRARPLSQENKAGDLDPAPVSRPHGLVAGNAALAPKLFAQEEHGMMAQRQSDMAIILDHFATGSHWSQRDDRLKDFGHGLALADRGRGEERQRFVAQRLDRP